MVSLKTLSLGLLAVVKNGTQLNVRMQASQLELSSVEKVLDRLVDVTEALQEEELLDESVQGNLWIEQANHLNLKIEELIQSSTEEKESGENLQNFQKTFKSFVNIHDELFSKKGSGPFGIYDKAVVLATDLGTTGKKYKVTGSQHMRAMANMGMAKKAIKLDSESQSYVINWTDSSLTRASFMRFFKKKETKAYETLVSRSSKKDGRDDALNRDHALNVLITYLIEVMAGPEGIFKRYGDLQYLMCQPMGYIISEGWGYRIEVNDNVRKLLEKEQRHVPSSPDQRKNFRLIKEFVGKLGSQKKRLIELGIVDPTLGKEFSEELDQELKLV